VPKRFFLYTLFLVSEQVRSVTFFKVICNWIMTTNRIVCHHLVHMRLG
jgi:hypothetical protein